MRRLAALVLSIALAARPRHSSSAYGLGYAAGAVLALIPGEFL